ncbi:efflux RND transporter periplasmic adaptor subunit [Gilvimarinus sp. DA14]|uniref:efflux RND transporter periplasmic adaptor subunit n=1 Tax=Gilvimarinus sp. DA14 TaxID=2956798 RepID=UPI0020B7685E|nr:efflux RND transporter periplasmic adaptor subunit [Gilvimarinus sp. DA14]UTF60014.1 efflux RND transporter periplasmic adaptor subunit [Gilvimarinus sp. DA14]
MQTPGFFRRNIRWLAPVLIIVVSIVALIALASMRTPPPERPPQNAAELVEVTTLNPGPMQLNVHSQGLVTAKYTTDLVAQVSGEIVSLAPAFERGGIVKKGELLATIDPTNYEVALENARANLASAEAGLEQEQAQSEVARVEWEDINDRPAPALGLRKPQLAQAEAQLTAARAALKQASKDLERTKIIAPYDALVAERNISLGTFVNVGTNMGQVMDVSLAQVRLPIAESEFRFLVGDGVGAEVNLRSGAKQWQARIVRGEGVVDSDTRMRYLVAELADPYQLQSNRDASKLTFGTYVQAEVEGIEVNSAVTVPRSLVRDGQLPLFDNGSLELRKVNVIREHQGEAIIDRGINAGDRMIKTALDYPVPGMQLEIRGAANTASSVSQASSEGSAAATSPGAEAE